MSIVWSGEIGFSSTGTYEFPDANGVYVIAEIGIDGKYHVRYVGQGNIHDRMEAHKDWSSEPNDCLSLVMKYTGNVKVKSTLLDNQTDRDNVEYTYWKHYQLNGHNLCNEIAPTGRFIEGIPLPF
jgi:hypothetical protein